MFVNKFCHSIIPINLQYILYFYYYTTDYIITLYFKDKCIRFYDKITTPKKSLEMFRASMNHR